VPVLYFTWTCAIASVGASASSTSDEPAVDPSPLCFRRSVSTAPTWEWFPPVRATSARATPEESGARPQLTGYPFRGRASERMRIG
jgi:hypothetical protein